MRLGTFEDLLRAMVGTCESNDGGRYSGDAGGFEMKGEFNMVGRLVIHFGRIHCEEDSDGIMC